MDKPQTLDHLEDNIRRVIAGIRPQMLEKVIENWTSRLDYIRTSRGSPMPEIIFKIPVTSPDSRIQLVRKTKSVCTNSSTKFTAAWKPCMRIPLTLHPQREWLQRCDKRLTWTHEWPEVIFFRLIQFLFAATRCRIRVWWYRGERTLATCIRQRHTGPSADMCLHAEIVEVEIEIVSPSIVPLGNFSELNRSVTCMVLKTNDRRTSCPCHDEFRGPRSDYVRQVELEKQQ
ncbi:hypothetical protein TNCV_617611 [Trichonephila clavipes]|nr:hypothetical protein TNCV_617611 [Trichonephila clavipes]